MVDEDIPIRPSPMKPHVVHLDPVVPNALLVCIGASLTAPLASERSREGDKRIALMADECDADGKEVEGELQA